eukprot:2591795-Amphidinium_carterae.1
MDREVATKVQKGNGWVAIPKMWSSVCALQNAYEGEMANQMQLNVFGSCKPCQILLHTHIVIRGSDFGLAPPRLANSAATFHTGQSCERSSPGLIAHERWRLDITSRICLAFLYSVASSTSDHADESTASLHVRLALHPF